MSTKPISPKDIPAIELAKYDLDHIVETFNNEIIKNHGRYPWEEIILQSEYPLSVRTEIASRFHSAGWTNIYHRTSSENGDRPVLTTFLMSTGPIPDNVTHNCYKYSPDVKKEDENHD